MSDRPLRATRDSLREPLPASRRASPRVLHTPALSSAAGDAASAKITEPERCGLALCVDVNPPRSTRSADDAGTHLAPLLERAAGRRARGARCGNRVRRGPQRPAGFGARHPPQAGVCVISGGEVEMAELRCLVQVPISGCDEVTHPSCLERLLALEAVDALRVDATVIGGLDVAGSLAGAATKVGVAMSLHEHPEIHRHCALAWPAVDRVELFPTKRPFDAAGALQLRPAASGVTRGYLPPPSELGIGIRLDVDAVSRNALRHARIPAGAVH